MYIFSILVTDLKHIYFYFNTYIVLKNMSSLRIKQTATNKY